MLHDACVILRREKARRACVSLAWRLFHPPPYTFEAKNSRVQSATQSTYAP